MAETGRQAPSLTVPPPLPNAALHHVYPVLSDIPVDSAPTTISRKTGLWDHSRKLWAHFRQFLYHPDEEGSLKEAVQGPRDLSGRMADLRPATFDLGRASLCFPS